jgi:hypothetical protein
MNIIATIIGYIMGSLITYYLVSPKSSLNRKER